MRLFDKFCFHFVVSFQEDQLLVSNHLLWQWLPRRPRQPAPQRQWLHSASLHQQWQWQAGIAEIMRWLPPEHPALQQPCVSLQSRLMIMVNHTPGMCTLHLPGLSDEGLLVWLSVCLSVCTVCLFSLLFLGLIMAVSHEYGKSFYLLTNMYTPVLFWPMHDVIFIIELTLGYYIAGYKNLGVYLSQLLNILSVKGIDFLLSFLSHA